MKIAVVIPCFKVRRHIAAVLRAIGPEVAKIYVVDDCCPERTGLFVKTECQDRRVEVLFHAANTGVGGAVITGYRKALEDGMDIVIKVDGDGQMDGSLIPGFVDPILCGIADYTKGHRFFSLELVRSMPAIRLFGNAVLSFMTKASSGYWQMMDPTNGFTAIHRCALASLPLDKLDKRYFFETDMLFRLNTIKAVIYDVPMAALYQDEKSSLKIRRTLGEFMFKHCSRVVKRVFYNYFLRDFNIGSLELAIGVFLAAFGLLFGGYNWVDAIRTGLPTPVGTIMLAALPAILGVQFLLAAVNYDMMNMPKEPLQRLLNGKPKLQMLKVQTRAAVEESALEAANR